MTTDKIIKKLEYISWLYGILGENERAINEAIEIVRVAQEAERNEPLTLDELMEMDGEPVWVVPGNASPRWCLVRVLGDKNWKSFDCVDGDRNEWDEDRYAVCGVINEDIEWLAYRRPPKEEQK